MANPEGNIHPLGRFQKSKRLIRRLPGHKLITLTGIMFNIQKNQICKRKYILIISHATARRIQTGMYTGRLAHW